MPRPMASLLMICILALPCCKSKKEPPASASAEQSEPAKDPQRNSDTSEIYVEYLGATALEVEQTIVLPIEESIRSVPSVKSVSSTAQEGFAVILVEHAPGTEKEVVLQEIAKAVNGLTSLPGEATLPIVHLKLPSDTAAQLWLLESLKQEDKVRLVDRLVQLASTARPIELKQELIVQVAPQKAAAFGLTPADLSAALSQTVIDVSLQGDFVVRGVEGGNVDLRELENTPVTGASSSQVVFLRDIAQITNAPAQLPAAWSSAGFGPQRTEVLALSLENPTSDLTRISKFIEETPGGSKAKFSGNYEADGQVEAKLQLAANLPREEVIEKVFAGLSSPEQALITQYEPDLLRVHYFGSNATRETRRDELRALLNLPGLHPSVVFYADQLPSKVRFTHDDLERLQEVVSKFSDKLRASAIPHFFLVPSKPALRISPRQEAYALGLGPSDIASQLRASTTGNEIGDLTLRWGPVRHPVESAHIQLTTPDGSLIPLSAVATVELRSEPALITRSEGVRSLPIEIHLSTRDQCRQLPALLKEITDRLPGLRVSVEHPATALCI